jgi:CubicO group peptidase (beta-lactamase class C family)
MASGWSGRKHVAPIPGSRRLLVNGGHSHHQGRRSRAIMATFAAACAVLSLGYTERTGGRAHWRTATPESQGVDSTTLAAMLEHVARKQLPLHHVLLIRHQAVVLDAAIYPYDGARRHDIASATKSVTSLLIGIAIDKGLIPSVQTPIAKLLPRMPPSADTRLSRLTVEELLTMRSGLDCDSEGGERALAAMRQSPDYTAFLLRLPFAAEPGARFAYCSGNNHLLSSIISARTGMSAHAFGRKHLFEPLGIDDTAWPSDLQGRTHGWGDLQLHPEAMARLGQLMLHEGRWNGRQIISQQWMRDSRRPLVQIRDGSAYGYSWWINTSVTPNIVEAEGRGGQRIAVLPAQDAVLVFNGGGINTDEIAPFVLDAMRTTEPLDANLQAAARLRKAIAVSREPPAPSAPAPFPARARTISGRTYSLAPNVLRWRTLSLTFEGKDARVTLGLGDRIWTGAIGLDGRYRFTTGTSGHSSWGVRGGWLSDDEFLLDLNTVAGINHFLVRIVPQDDQIRLAIDEVTGELKNLVLTGRAASSADTPTRPR